MSIDYDPRVLEHFFGTVGYLANQEGNPRVVWIEYVAPRLKYVVILDFDRETAAVSGDIDQPFGGDSMYQITVPCSAIVSGPDPYWSEQECLTFFYGGNDLAAHRRMTIMKARNGELKVWPYFPFPPGHPLV